MIEIIIQLKIVTLVQKYKNYNWSLVILFFYFQSKRTKMTVE